MMSKNIFLLSADKTSRLVKHWTGRYELFKNPVINNHAYIAKDVYITSDEEIKDGNYAIQFYYGKSSIVKCDAQNKFVVNNKYNNLYAIKIMLTTDSKLIEDGVQAINDEFLEWFVKNPSCEYVNIEKYHGINTSIAEVNYISGDGSLSWQGRSDLRDYKIIIPKEEPKQEETLVEAGLKHCDMLDELPALVNPLFSFKEGAKWQAERMYNEDEVLNILYKHTEDLLAGKKVTLEEWFNQYKKK